MSTDKMNAAIEKCMTSKINKQTGATMIEVLISALVMGVGLLGIMSLQARSLQYNQNAYLYSQAVFLAQDMAERMLANPDAADDYPIDLDDPSPNSATDLCTNASCTPEQIADWDKSIWRANISAALPSGKGAVTQNLAANEFVIEISFDGSRGESDEQHYYLVLDVK
jgi:type IV pilus assembly protein PilV